MFLNEQSGIRRWLVFSCVGFMGIGVQMAMLWILTSCLHLGYLLATALSVEAAVLHNFCWHERWTWSDRIAGHSNGRVARLVSFHLTNGAFSMAGNLILMRFLVGEIGFNYFFANALAITVCAILNYIAGDRIVFRAIPILISYQAPPASWQAQSEESPPDSRLRQT